MSPRVTHMDCPFCDKEFTRATVRRHARGACNAAQREALTEDTDLQRLMNPDMTAAIERPRREAKRRGPRAAPPPPPVAPPPPAVPPAPPPGVYRQSATLATLPGQPPAYVPGNVPNPVLDEFEALCRELPRHPELFDPHNTSRNAQPTLSNPDEGPAPAEASPWLRGLSSEGILRQELVAQAARNNGIHLTALDMLIIRGFNFKIDTNITSRAYQKLPRAFPELDQLPTEQRTRTRIAFLSGVSSIKIDCCVGSCVAFTGEYAEFDECPHCGKDRYEPDPSHPGKTRPRNTFNYIPLIPRLISMYRDPEMQEKLRYRANRRPPDDEIADIFDGSYYKRLLNRRVWVRGRRLDHSYFDMPTDIALGLSTDGFGPFKTKKKNCWPLMLINYNLDPSIRTRLENAICLGVIPGPGQPKEIGTFLRPMIDEFQDLATGIAAYDCLNDRPFALRAYLITFFGDMPAVAKVMSMKGAGAKVPCRACRIVGVHDNAQGNTRFYVPLSRPFADNPRPYDPYNLPARDHAQYLRHTCSVEQAGTTTQEEERSMRFGVGFTSPLAELASIEFPASFPHDVMHLVFENVIPGLFELWTRTERYAKFGTGSEQYLIPARRWSEVGRACKKSGDTIPAAFGCRVPDFSDGDVRVTAEARMIFTTMLGPALLHKQLHGTYFDHFVRFVQLMNDCLSFSITTEKLQKLREGLATWVEDFERLYYRHQVDRLRACTLPIHALLHLADDIETMGPVWCYWAFPMERFCGSLARANLNPQSPWSSLNRHVLEVAQLTQIKHLYGLTSALSLEEERYNMATGTRYDPYPGLVFVYPTRTRVLHSCLWRKVAAYVSAVTGAPLGLVLAAVQTRQFVLWGRMQHTGDNGRGGDLVRGHALSPCLPGRSRDASYVKMSRWNRTRPRVLDQPTLGYGRAEQFVVIDVDFLQEMAAHSDNPSNCLDPLVLAVISPLPTFSQHKPTGMVRYRLSSGNHAPPEIIDAQDLECLIGRMDAPDGFSYIIDRASVVGRLNFFNSLQDPR